MSAKYYCDFCLEQITDKNKCSGAPDKSNRLGVNKMGFDDHTLSLEVMVAVDGTWNSGEVCKHCVMHALNLAIGSKP